MIFLARTGMSSGFSRRELLELAVENEKNAAGFYSAASGRFRELKVPFEVLSDEEEDHARMYSGLLSLPGEAIPEAAGVDAMRHLQAVVEDRRLDSLGKVKTLAERIHDPFDALAAALGLERDTLILYYVFSEILRGQDRKTVQKIMEIEKRHLSEVADFIVHGALLFRRGENVTF